MAKPFPLQTLVLLAKQKNDAAVKNLGRLNQQHHSAEAKLQMLQQFRKDYQEKFQEAVSIGMSPVDLRNFQEFIYRLDQAIAQQQGVLTHTSTSLESGRELYRDTQRSVQSFETLAQRHWDAESKREAKAEQKAQDEYASRFAARKSIERLNDEQEPTPSGVHHE